MAGAPAVALAAVRKAYGDQVAVEDLDLEVPDGSVYGFLGPNGAGKTTTLRILLGLLRADAGAARILGQDCWRDGPALRREVGYLPGDVRLPAWMNGHDALRLSGAARGRDLRAAGAALAEDLDLDLGVRVRAMSRGMRQKLGLITALAHAPRVLVLDEPTSGLDPIAQARLQALLRARAQDGATVLFSSHVLSEVQDLCARVAILRRGRKVADEALDVLRRRAGRALQVRFTGAGPAEVPEWLELHRRDRSTDGDTDGGPDEGTDELWTGGLRAPVPQLLAWLHGQPVVDLEIGPPDLDRLFRGYYEDEAP